MKTFHIKEFFKGWIVGKFQPSILQENFEVGIIHHNVGDVHCDHFHKESVEINVVLNGRISINGQEFTDGDIFVLYPYEISQAEFLTDVTLVVIRNKSNPTDKYQIKIIDN